MKKLKLLLLGLFTPLFIGVSFGYDSYAGFTSFYTDSYSWSSSSSSKTFDTNFVAGKSYCGRLYGGTSSYAITAVRFKCDTSTQLIANGNISKGSFFCFSNYCTSTADLVVETSGALMSSSYNVEMFAVDFNVSVSSDCSSVENQLSSCQSDLASCQNDGSHCDTLYGKCVEDYSGCQSDLSSLQNYNQSLTDQLNECLNNSSTSGDVNSGNCLTSSLFWYDNDNMFSLPITNNLFLPMGYQGYINSGNVLGISDIEDNTVVYEFDQESKENTINSMSIIMLFLVATGFIIFVIRFLKKLFFKF